MELNSGNSSVVGHNLELNPIVVSCLFHSKLLQIFIPFQAINVPLRIESKETNKNAKTEL